MDRRPCQGVNSNICVMEGCYGEACLRLPDHDSAPWSDCCDRSDPHEHLWPKVRAALSLLFLVACILVVFGIAGSILFALVVP